MHRATLVRSLARNAHPNALPSTPQQQTAAAKQETASPVLDALDGGNRALTERMTADVGEAASRGERAPDGNIRPATRGQGNIRALRLLEDAVVEKPGDGSIADSVKIRLGIDVLLAL
jgi:hypothetical protein